MRPTDDPLRVKIRANDPLVESGLQVLAREAGAVVVTSEPDVCLIAGVEPDALDEPTPTLALVVDEDGAVRAWSAGARGVLARGVDAGRLAAALAGVALDLAVIDPVFASLTERATRTTTELVESLTPREDEVLELLAEGLSNRKIAGRLEISEHTVKFHVNAILEKLDADTRTEAVVRAARLGLLLL